MNMLLLNKLRLIVRNPGGANTAVFKSTRNTTMRQRRITARINHLLLIFVIESNMMAVGFLILEVLKQRI